MVGAGSAGCVVASRLSEDATKRVLLLEAGPKDSNPMIHMPGGCQEVLKSKTLNWQFWSEPQKHLHNRIIYVPRGRMLGGSSGLNGMLYNRGHADDYNDWAAAGNPGWAYRDILPYFSRAEDNVRGASEWHGAGGPLQVSEAPMDHILFDKFIEAGVEVGLPRNHDFNGATQDGVGRYQFTLRDGKRCSAAVAYLRPAWGRSNLVIVTGAHVQRLLLKGESVTGVEYLRGRSRQVASIHAGGEVILSAGTIQNPQILQLSGIGHPDDLGAFGIKTEIELPGVGHNLQEHLDLKMHYEVTRPITLNAAASLLPKIKMGLQYLLTRTGPAAGSGIAVGGYYRSNPALTRPDIQLHFTTRDSPFSASVLSFSFSFSVFLLVDLLPAWRYEKMEDCETTTGHVGHRARTLMKDARRGLNR